MSSSSTPTRSEPESRRVRPLCTRPCDYSRQASSVRRMNMRGPSGPRRKAPSCGTRRAQTGLGLRRGEIRLVDFDPSLGSEANKRRPAVVVSNDGANTIASQLGRGVLTVVPVTSNVSRVYPFQVLLPASEVGLDRESKAQAEQIRSIDV